MRITRKRRMRTMDDEHNNVGDTDGTTIKRKQGRWTRTRDEDKGQGQGTRTMWDNDDDNEDEVDR